MTELDTTTQPKKELSKPLRNLIKLLARIAVEQYLEEEREKAANPIINDHLNLKQNRLPALY